MNNLVSKFSRNRTIELDEVKFSRNERFKQGNEYEIQMVDSIDAVTAEDYLGIVIKREISCEPEGPFDIFVSYIIKHYLKNGEKIDWDNVDIKQLVDENKEMFVCSAMETTSLLISQLTAAYGHVPLITPSAITE